MSARLTPRAGCDSELGFHALPIKFASRRHRLSISRRPPAALRDGQLGSSLMAKSYNHRELRDELGAWTYLTITRYGSASFGLSRMGNRIAGTSQRHVGIRALRCSQGQTFLQSRSVRRKTFLLRADEGRLCLRL